MSGGTTKGRHIPITLKSRVKIYSLWQVWQGLTDKETGERLDTFALVTTDADKLMTQVHNKKKRMPTILNKERAEAWMDPDLPEKEIKKIATFHTPDILKGQTIRKDFRIADDPMKPNEYAELPPVEVI